jgi:hypothetical protein
MPTPIQARWTRPPLTPAAVHITHNDAVCIAAAIAHLLHQDRLGGRIQLAGAMEGAIRGQYIIGLTGQEACEGRHLRLMSWIADRMGLMEHARDRAHGHRIRASEGDLKTNVTEDGALVVGLDIVLNRALHMMDPIEEIAVCGWLMTTAAVDAAS